MVCGCGSCVRFSANQFSHTPINTMLARTARKDVAVLRAARAFKTSRRTYASGQESHSAPKKEFEVSITKVFGVAAVAGGLYMYRGMDKRDEPVVKTALYKEVEERTHLREENYLNRYKTSFIKSYMRDKGGIGQRQNRRQTEGAVSSTLIPAHSPYGDQFGAGIKTAELGPRRERIRLYAPLENK